MAKEIIFEKRSDGKLRPVAVERTALGFTKLATDSAVALEMSEEQGEYVAGINDRLENEVATENFKAGFGFAENLI